MLINQICRKLSTQRSKCNEVRKTLILEDILNHKTYHKMVYRHIFVMT